MQDIGSEFRDMIYVEGEKSKNMKESIKTRTA